MLGFGFDQSGAFFPCGFGFFRHCTLHRDRNFDILEFDTFDRYSPGFVDTSIFGLA